MFGKSLTLVFSLAVAWCVAGLGVLASWGFFQDFDPPGIVLVLFGIGILGSLIYLLVKDHYEVAFVYQVTSSSMPTYLKVTAWWGGQAGSLVFWGWLLSAFTSAVALRKWDRDREFLPWVIVVAAITQAFFLGLVVFYENPFSRYWEIAGSVQASMFPPQGARLFFPDDGQLMSLKKRIYH